MMYSVFTPNGRTWTVALGGVVLRTGFRSYEAAQVWADCEGEDSGALASNVRTQIWEQ